MTTWRGTCAYCEFDTGEVVALEIAERLLLDHAREVHPEITRPDFEYVSADDSATPQRGDT